MLLCNSYLDFCFSSRPNKCKICQGKVFKPQISLLTSGQQLLAVSVHLRFMETNVSGFLLTQASIRALGKNPFIFLRDSQIQKELFIQLLYCTCFPLFEELYLYTLCKDKLHVIGNTLTGAYISCS